MVLLLDKKIDFFLSQIIKRVRCWCTAAKGTEKKKKKKLNWQFYPANTLLMWVYRFILFYGLSTPYGSFNAEILFSWEY